MAGASMGHSKFWEGASRPELRPFYGPRYYQENSGVEKAQVSRGVVGREAQG